MFFCTFVQPRRSKRNHLLVHNSLNTVTARLQGRHPWAIRESDKVVARRVEQISPSRWVQVKEDTRHHNDLLLQTRLEKVQTVADGTRKTLQVEPEVKGRVGHRLDVEAHLAETVNHVVTLGAEVALERLHLAEDEAGLQHGDSGLLERHVGATVQVRTTAANGLDELLGTNDPGNTPSGQTEALGQTVNNKDVVLVDILDILL